ncbi:MAG: TlpA family protein disulfide reductase [Betaproteobacteria bacterium]|nr:TlpA family protein disulfide reductase [Betaproteobacteria bacterium]
MQRAREEYHKGGVAVLAISIDGQGAQAVRPLMAEHKYTVPAPLDPDMQVARALGVRVVPWTVVIDRSGAVVAGGYGPIDLLSPAFRNYVKALAASP